MLGRFKLEVYFWLVLVGTCFRQWPGVCLAGGLFLWSIFLSHCCLASVWPIYLGIVRAWAVFAFTIQGAARAMPFLDLSFCILECFPEQYSLLLLCCDGLCFSCSCRAAISNLNIIFDLWLMKHISPQDLLAIVPTRSLGPFYIGVHRRRLGFLFRRYTCSTSCF